MSWSGVASAMDVAKIRRVHPVRHTGASPSEPLSIRMTDTAAQGSPPSGQAILVLGMHRSGTSALARVLGLMGAWIGDDDELLPPHPTDNPTGYWERADVVHSHEDFLAEVGHGWDRIAGFDWPQLKVSARNELDARLRSIVASFHHGDRPWLLKDPRLCLLLPAWKAILPKPVYVVAVRDPRETAVSMLSSHRGDYTTHFLLALWERYLHTVLADLAGERVLFVSYSRLLEDPIGQSKRLLDGLGALGIIGLQPADADQLGIFLDVRLKRSKPREHMRLSPSQERLDDWLDQQCKANGPVSVGKLDDDGSDERVLVEYEHAVEHQVQLGRSQALGNVTDRLNKLERDLTTQREEAERILLDARQRADQAEAKAQFIADQNSELELRLSDALHESERLAGECTLTRNHAFNLTGQIDSLSLQVENNLATIDALQGSLSWRITRPVRWVAKSMRPRIPYGMEQWLYRAYYAIPGINTTRKRALITWLHRKMPWLTGSTLSHDINARTEALVRRRTGDSEERKRLQRINAEQATTFVARMTETPLISIVMPVYNVDPRWLNAAVESVRKQFYPHWQLCIADDGSTLPATREALDAIEALADARIVITRLDTNQGIAGASNAALGLATGDYIGLLDHDDELTRDALLEMVRQILQKRPDLLYSDEDKLDEEGRHIDPHFKPDFSPDYLLSNNYVCHFSVLKRSLVERIGGFRTGFDGAQDFDLVLRAAEAAESIVHVPQVLYHWRRVPGSTAVTSAAKPESSVAGRRALIDAMKRRGEEATIEPGPYPNTFRVRRSIIDTPLVSILIPFRDKPALLMSCVTSILERTDYRNYEIIGIDNGSVDAQVKVARETLEKRDSRVRFLDYDAPFNYSAINNYAASQSNGEHLLMLNNDTEVISAEWLRAMLEHSQRPEVGVVGAQLLYPDRSLQHAGVIIGLGGVAGHSHLMLPSGHPGYFSRPRLIQNLSAVTFACAMTRRDVFEKLGGLNDKELTVAFNDIDYCLRAREAGYLVVYTPYASLFHRESKTRGLDVSPQKRARFSAEIDYMQSRHAGVFKHGDPYYNPHLSLLENFQPDFRYADALPL